VTLRGESGLTFIEVLVVMLIMGGVIGSLTTVFVSGMRAEQQMSQRFQVQNQARTALDRLRRDVHCASTLSSGWTSSSVTLVNDCSPQGSVTWCTQANGTRFSLHRAPGSGPCSTANPRLASDLLSGTAFDFQNPSEESLAKLRVDLRVILPGVVNPYRLCDLIVLRNSSRTVDTHVPVADCP